MNKNITLPKDEAERAAMVAEQEERINKQATAICLFHPFFSSLLLSLYRKPSWSIPTMATDGVSIYWNPAFTASMNDNEIRGVLVHECLHPGLGHLWRFQPSWDKHIANMAADFMINNFLDNYNQGVESNQKLLLPDIGICLDHKYDDMSMEHVYSILINDPEARKKATGGRGEGGAGDPGGSYVSIGEVMEPGTNPTTGEETTAAEWAQNMSKAANVARAMGKLPQEIERMLGNALKPQVDWVSVLSQFMDSQRNDDYDWQRSDRRYIQSGFYLPGMYSEGMGPIAIVIDTSGSVDGDMLNRFASEIMAISSRLKPDKIVVVYCDADVQREEIFRPGDLIQLHPKGGGGTDFAPALNYLDTHHPDIMCASYLTDGYGSHRNHPPSYPILWIDYGGCDYPYGQVVRVPELAGPR